MPHCTLHGDTSQFKCDCVSVLSSFCILSILASLWTALVGQASQFALYTDSELQCCHWTFEPLSLHYLTMQFQSCSGHVGEKLPHPLLVSFNCEYLATFMNSNQFAFIWSFSAVDIKALKCRIQATIRPFTPPLLSSLHTECGRHIVHQFFRVLLWKSPTKGSAKISTREPWVMQPSWTSFFNKCTNLRVQKTCKGRVCVPV